MCITAAAAGKQNPGRTRMEAAEMYGAKIQTITGFQSRIRDSRVGSDRFESSQASSEDKQEQQQAIFQEGGVEGGEGG